MNIIISRECNGTHEHLSYMQQVAAEDGVVVLAHVSQQLRAAHVGARRHAVHAAPRLVQRVRLQVPAQVHVRVELLTANLAAVRCVTVLFCINNIFIIFFLYYYTLSSSINYLWLLPQL